eukprot:355515-Chlamydomonas_euryale.AAC.12
MPKLGRSTCMRATQANRTTACERQAAGCGETQTARYAQHQAAAARAVPARWKPDPPYTQRALPAHTSSTSAPSDARCAVAPRTAASTAGCTPSPSVCATRPTRTPASGELPSAPAGRSRRAKSTVAAPLLVASMSSPPAMALSSSAASSTVLAIGPMQSSDDA